MSKIVKNNIRNGKKRISKNDKKRISKNAKIKEKMLKRE